MPQSLLAEFILEPIFRLLGYLLFHTLFFWTGFVFLEIVTFGKLDLATPEKFPTPGAPMKRKGSSTRLWLHDRKKKQRQLRPEVTAIVGTAIWMIAITAIIIHKTLA